MANSEKFAAAGCGVIALIMLALVCAGVALFVTAQNGMVRGANDVQGKWAQVENNYQRRTDLYNTEVATIKGMTAEEQKYFATFTQEAAALGGTLNQYYAGQIGDAALQAQIAATNKSLVDVKTYVFDAHPEITSTDLFKAFMVEVEGTENRIAISRMDYNTSVQSYRNSVQTFPGSLIAGIAGFSADKFPFFQAQPGAQNAPTIDFGNSPTAIPATPSR